ncbi:MAG TPA: UDP-N-acetylglucosamine 2-epimerase [Anaerolineales bacterium]|nr:UDP-N-acetylglucosamine 2-epimerase [Anaerolineales bacterium]
MGDPHMQFRGSQRPSQGRICVPIDQDPVGLFCQDDLLNPRQHSSSLFREGITQGVDLVGDVMVDALKESLALSGRVSHVVETLGLEPHRYALLTIHRAANTDDPRRLEAILSAVGQVDQTVVFPVHPRTQHVIEQQAFTLPANVRAIDPVGYLEMLQLENLADCILTDSGGVQKEAYVLGVRCITLREETEWVETVAQGWNRLVGADPQAIVSAVRDWFPQGERPMVYGDGQAAEKVAARLA